jgi:dTDP-4-dehydrorhamnose 3,5-epimerase
MISVIETPIAGCWLISTDKFDDRRGSFREWLPNQACSEITGGNFVTAQANYSVSHKGTIRGIHYSTCPEGQAKIVTCLTGSIFDVAVDLRKESPTYGQWFGVVLSAESPKTLYVGVGLGHAFMALEENSCVAYLLSSPYNPGLEFGIDPFDSTIAISWPQGPYLLSEKDKFAPKFNV